MKFTEITAKDNPTLKLARALQSSSKARKEKSLFALEGIRICKDAYENGIRFYRLIVSKTALNRYEKEIEVLSCISDEVVLIPDSLFLKIGDTDNPQGVMALAYIPEMKTEIYKSGKYVALENLADPSNMGAVFRTAEALGLNGVIIAGSCCDLYSPKSLRASMGTIIRVPVFFTDDLPKLCGENGLKLFSCVVDRDAVSVKSVNFSNGTVIAIGNEANGLTDSTKQKSDMLVTIDMCGRAESLNAAAAAAIAMWEMMR